MCSVVYGQVTVDQGRATLKDLVEGVLQLELGYGEELAVTKGEVVIYDPEMDDVLPKRLVDLGIKNETVLTVRDEDDQDKNPRVNLQLEVLDRYVLFQMLTFQGFDNDQHRTDPSDRDSKPVALRGVLDIPRKRTPPPTKEDIGPDTNGASVIGKRKREAEDESLTNGHIAKKVAGGPSNGDEHDLIVLDEEEGGAILID